MGLDARWTPTTHHFEQRQHQRWGSQARGCEERAKKNMVSPYVEVKSYQLYPKLESFYIAWEASASRFRFQCLDDQWRRLENLWVSSFWNEKLLFKQCIVHQNSLIFHHCCTASSPMAEINRNSWACVVVNFVGTRLYEKRLVGRRRCSSSGPSGCPNTCEFSMVQKQGKLTSAKERNNDKLWVELVEKMRDFLSVLRKSFWILPKKLHVDFSVEIFQLCTCTLDGKMKELVVCQRRCYSSL